MPSYINPNTIDLNTQKSAPELQSNFDAIQAALNGGLDEVNVPNLAAAFTTWKTVEWGGGVLAMGAGGTYLIAGGGAPQGSGAQLLGSAGTALWIVDLDPADWAANARTTKLRIRWSLTVNAVAPATNFAPGLYPVATTGGASGSAASIATLGAVVAGSTATFTAPAATSHTVTLSTEFNAPSAGPYVFGVVAGGGVAAGSSSALIGHVQMRQV